MKLVFPSAGMGTRLRPHTLVSSKTLIPVVGRPIIDHIIRPLLPLLSEMIFIVGNQNNSLRKYVFENYDKPVHFVHQPQREGLGHAISLAGEHIKNEPILIVLDDGILGLNPQDILNQSDSLIGVRSVENPSDFGIVELDEGETSVPRAIKCLVEKPRHPRSNLAIAGMYYIKKGRFLVDCLNHLIEKDIRGAMNEFQLTDGLQLMLERGEKIRALEIDWVDCGKIEALLNANRILLDRNDKPTKSIETKNALLIPPVWVGENTNLKDSVIGPYVSIGDYTEIVDSVVKDSIIDTRAKLSSSLVSRSVIGQSAQITGTFSKINIGPYSELKL